MFHVHTVRSHKTYVKSYKLHSPTSLGQTSVSLHSRLHLESATLRGLPSAFTVDSPPLRVPAAPGWLPDVPSSLLYSHSFFVLGWIMLLTEA